MNLFVKIALLFGVLQAQNTNALCAKLTDRRVLVIDVRTAAQITTAAPRICASYDTQNLPADTLTAANIAERILALRPAADNTAWTSFGQNLGVSQDRTRRYRNVTWEGQRGNLRWWNTTGTPILVYGQTAALSAQVVALINGLTGSARFLGGVTDGGAYSTLNTACPRAPAGTASNRITCPLRTCALFANANNIILDTRVNSPGSSVRGYAASTRLCVRTKNLNRRNPWTTAQVTAAVGAVKTATILTLCYRGNWAEDARQELIARGYTNVINIGGYQGISALRCRSVGNVPQRGVTCASTADGNNAQGFRCLRTYVQGHASYNASECSGAEDPFFAPAPAPQSGASTTRLAAVMAITMAAFAYAM